MVAAAMRVAETGVGRVGGMSTAMTLDELYDDGDSNSVHLGDDDGNGNDVHCCTCLSVGKILRCSIQRAKEE